MARISGALQFSDDLVFGRDIAVHLRGGYAEDFSTSSGSTVLKGRLAVSGGTVELGGITFR
jgi:hypothetical protein